MCTCLSEAANGIVIAVMVVVELFQTDKEGGKAQALQKTS